MKAVALLAHPDDCVIFARPFIENHNEYSWQLVYLTYSEQDPRAKEISAYWQTKNIPCRFLGLVDNYKDLETNSLSFDPESAGNLLRQSAEDADLILTHNSDGEYNHIHHKFVHTVAAAIDKPKVYFANDQKYNKEYLAQDILDLDKLPLHRSVIEQFANINQGRYWVDTGDLPKNICLAPFAYITFDPANNVSPCPALGGSTWKFPNQSIKEVWSSDTLKDFRQHMLDNGQHEVCNRCWYEESVGMASQRTRLFDPSQDSLGTKTKILDTEYTAKAVLDPTFYSQGPMQLAIKVGNICNLRCRSCNSADSVTLSIEGQYYADNYGLKDNFWLLETEPKVFTDQQIAEILDISANVRRIEFYGGEPLVDKQMPKLLDQLVKRNLAKNIQLNISTNITHRMDDDLIETLSHFEQVNINLSIDGWAEKFTYLRHPAEWSKVYENIQWFIKLRDSQRLRLSLLPAITVTSMNVYDLPELITNIKTEFDLPVFLIIAGHPAYFSIKNIPKNLAMAIAAHLTQYQLDELAPVIRALANTQDNEYWTWFKRVTVMIDQYRKENFTTTFSNYYQLIMSIDKDWPKEL